MPLSWDTNRWYFTLTLPAVPVQPLGVARFNRLRNFTFKTFPVETLNVPNKFTGREPLPLFFHLLDRFHKGGNGWMPEKEPGLPCHGFQGPEGWTYEATENTFTASATEGKGVQKGQTAHFLYRVGTKGAVLANAPVVATTASGREIVIDGVWVSSKEPRSYILLVAGSLAIIALFHTWRVLRKRRAAAS